MNLTMLYCSAFWTIKASCFQKKMLFPVLRKQRHSWKNVVVHSVREVWDFFEEEGIDVDGVKGDEILEADEVFDVGDGRYLIVEG